ncbi:MAG: ATP-binding cassette domain-containing protein, partial [Tissierellia bacterium]|nr:ATP-binding cassette domain-containing protein [Tissierellia bacterium]
YIFLADKILFTIAIFMLFLYVILFRLLKEKIYEINFEMIESQSEYFKAGRINLSNLRAIKLKNFYDRLISIFDLSFIRLFKAALKEQKLSYIYSSLDSIIKDIMQIIIFIYGGSMVLSKRLTIGEFTVISVFFSYLIGAIGFFFSFFKSVESTKTSFDRIIEIKKIKGEEDGGIKLENIDSIKINNLTFGYDKMPIIDKLNIEFKKGLHIIKGINGSGKSTLFYLLEGLFTDFKGQILFDDVEIKQLNLIEFRKNNIDILLQSYDDENPFDDQFKKLSGGQKQLNALKDILKKDGDIILLDEAFSSLDEIKKKEAKDLILKFKNKKIIIAIMHDDYLDDIACNIINIQAQ